MAKKKRPDITRAEPAERTPPRVLPNEADPAVDYTTAAAQPGALRGEAALWVQTRQAQSLIRGRGPSEGKPRVIGLIRFGMMIHLVWLAAEADDPYADWCLLRVQEALKDARRDLGQSQDHVQSLLRAERGVEIGVGASIRPVRIPLRFSTPYGYMGAYLVADYDNLVRTCLTAKHVGLGRPGYMNQLMDQGAHRVRSVFHTVQAWRYSGINREDVRQRTRRALAAEQALGEVPQEIVDGTLRAEVAPKLKVQAAGENASTNTSARHPLSPPFTGFFPDNAGDPRNGDPGATS